MRILAIEDEPFYREFLSTSALKSFDVVFADSANEALSRLLAGQKFAVVISGYYNFWTDGVRGLTGADLFERIADAGVDVRAILLTNLEEDDVKVLALEHSLRGRLPFHFYSKGNVRDLRKFLAQLTAELAPPFTNFHSGLRTACDVLPWRGHAAAIH